MENGSEQTKRKPARPSILEVVAAAQHTGVAFPAEAAGAALDGAPGVGLGVDIVEIARMKRILARTPAFRRRVFSSDEQEYCDSKGVPEIHYATRFAAKEAVLKALGTGFSSGIGPRDVEVVRNAKGKPSVVLTGRARQVAESQGIQELPISLSYTHTEAVACAMALTARSAGAVAKRSDPMEELAHQFKEARGLLDEADRIPPARTGAPRTGAGAGGAGIGETDGERVEDGTL